MYCLRKVVYLINFVDQYDLDLKITSSLKAIFISLPHQNMLYNFINALPYYFIFQQFFIQLFV